MLWKIQEICSKMGTKFIEIDEEMSVIIDAKGGNPQNSTGKKWANLSQHFSRIIFSKNMLIFQAKEYQSEKSPKFDSQKGNNLLCAAKEYDQIYWFMYSSPAFKFKGSGVVVHPIYWVMHISNSFRFKGIYHRQSNKLGRITHNQIYWLC